MQKHKYQAYAAATQTVARTKQIVMLYDGIIRFMQHAREAIEQNRIEDRYNMLTKASDVIMGLQACLDFENGGQVAKVLYQFYSSIDSQIYAIHRNNSIDACNTIIADMKKMRDVWQEIDEATGGSSPEAPPPAKPKAAAEPASSKSTPGSEQSITISA
ncbi:MAG: flagellar export chaperone FliS [Rickettsiales bacterium]|nr:flagellar export chaperone FliS [Rickettsiales bacterium]